MGKALSGHAFCPERHRVPLVGGATKNTVGAALVQRWPRPGLRVLARLLRVVVALSVGLTILVNLLIRLF